MAWPVGQTMVRHVAEGQVAVLYESVECLEPGRYADCEFVYLRGIEIKDSEFSKCYFGSSDMDFENCEFYGVFFSNCKGTFRNCNLEKCGFSGCRFEFENSKTEEENG